MAFQFVTTGEAHPLIYIKQHFDVKYPTQKDESYIKGDTKRSIETTENQQIICQNLFVFILNLYIKYILYIVVEAY